MHYSLSLFLFDFEFCMHFSFIFSQDIHEGIYGQNGSIGSGRRSYSQQGVYLIFALFLPVSNLDSVPQV